MVAPVSRVWLPPDTQAIALTQTLAGAGSLTLNGTLAQGGTVDFHGFARVVSLTSANNLSAVNFTVTGSVNGASVSETLAGPNNTTVETANIFDGVTSVTSSNAANGISIGTGTTGHTGWILTDTYAPFPSVGIQVITTGVITWSFIATLQDVSNKLPNALSIFTPVVGLTNQNASAQGVYGNPFLYGAVEVTASGANGALTAIFLRQGPA